MSQSICCLASRGFKGAVISALRTVTSLGLHKFMFTNLLKVGCVPQVFSYYYLQAVTETGRKTCTAVPGSQKCPKELRRLH